MTRGRELLHISRARVFQIVSLRFCGRADVPALMRFAVMNYLQFEEYVRVRNGTRTAHVSKQSSGGDWDSRGAG
jgi:hypothetical protein